MAKRSQWACTECGAKHVGWFGQCPSCDAWNTLVEQAPSAPDRVVLAQARAVPVGEVRDDAPRLACGLGEVDRVLGGGWVPGSVTLLGGPPGIGKSTLLLQVSAALAAAGGTVLYASGEESVTQIASRAKRLDADDPRLLVLADTRVEAVLDAARECAAAGGLAAVVVDSVQTVYTDSQEGLPGNVTQIRAVAAQLISFAKGSGVPVVLVGHVTKDGQLAGPRVLEHMVDTVLAFDGDDQRATRMLRASKNRFGSTLELGVFEMTQAGLHEVSNPSEAFLSERPQGVAGSCVTASIQGTRPLLLEVQALLAPSGGGSPRRNCVGVDASRLAMLLAVLDRHGGLDVLEHDVFANVAGGIRLIEPAADLAVLLAVASSHTRKALPQRWVAIGEVGLTGELRPPPGLEVRLAEAGRLGFTHAVMAPPGRQGAVPEGLEILRARTVAEALEVTAT